MGKITDMKTGVEILITTSVATTCIVYSKQESYNSSKDEGHNRAIPYNSTFLGYHKKSHSTYIQNSIFNGSTYQQK